MAARNPYTIDLAPDLERFVRSIVASGLYHSVNEVVQEALWLLKERESFLDLSPEEARERIAVGLQQADRGELLDGEAVFQEIEGRFGIALDAI